MHQLKVCEIIIGRAPEIDNNNVEQNASIMLIIMLK